MKTERSRSRSHAARTAMIVAFLMAGTVHGQEAANPVQDAGWPRVFEKDGQVVALYQPQIDSWENYRKITFRAAVAVIAGERKEAVYGVIDAQADTKVDPDTRMVLAEYPRNEIRFAGLEPAEADRMATIVNDALPKRKSVEIALDRVLAYMDQQKTCQREVEVNLVPPRIFYSQEPAILLLYDGAPQFKPIPGTRLMFAVNANWDVLMDVTSTQYYLLDGESWLTAPDPLKGSWQAAGALPAEFSRLPGSEEWKDMRARIPGKPAGKVPMVFASDKPAEIIVTEGEPRFTPIPGTRLMYIANTQNPLILCNTDGYYYYLVTGRWFRGRSLEGPWEAATRSLPAEFARIPDDNPLAYVRSSVPKTTEAADAVLLASVPHKATVTRKDAKLEVIYEGAPVFATIRGTAVKCAINTAEDVFEVNGAYYCCKDGVWFTAPNATGPWMVCALVPPEIYAIPPGNPKHYVTYVYVYDSTPEAVEVGYTGGYTGQYVTNGLLVFGTGLAIGYALGSQWYDDWDEHWDVYYHYIYHGPFYTYGVGAVYHPYWGGYYAGYGAVVGPHGGAVYAYGPYAGVVRAAHYNPATGIYSRGAYRYGPAGGAYARAAYNPSTDTGAIHAGASNVYGSWGRTVVARDDEWIRGGHRTTATGTTGWVQTSKGGEFAGTTQGVDKFIGKTGEGDIYAGRDGNVYRRQDGQWQKWDDGGWNDADFEKHATGFGANAQTQRERAMGAKTGEQAGPGSSRLTGRAGAGESPIPARQADERFMRPAKPVTGNLPDDLNYNYQARKWSDAQTTRYQRAQTTTRTRPSLGGRVGGGGGRLRR
ncbi:MAG: hypothetical protein M1457_13425 [bacterium]|nr:hypothetical protein [bacterium]